MIIVIVSDFIECLFIKFSTLTGISEKLVIIWKLADESIGRHCEDYCSYFVTITHTNDTVSCLRNIEN